MLLKTDAKIWGGSWGTLHGRSRDYTERRKIKKKFDILREKIFLSNLRVYLHKVKFTFFRYTIYEF